MYWFYKILEHADLLLPFCGSTFAWRIEFFLFCSNFKRIFCWSEHQYGIVRGIESCKANVVPAIERGIPTTGYADNSNIIPEWFSILLYRNAIVVSTFASGCARLLFLYDDVFCWMDIHGRSHIVSKHKHLEPGTLNVFFFFFVTLFIQIFFTISNILSVVVSVATLIVNLLLALLITREGRYTTDKKRQTFLTLIRFSIVCSDSTLKGG